MLLIKNEKYLKYLNKNIYNQKLIFLPAKTKKFNFK